MAGQVRLPVPYTQSPHYLRTASMPPIHGFPPIAGPLATRLVLGSMPGVASLAARQYYAHPRNSFWRIVEATLGVAEELGYDARCAGLVASGVALWDVLAQCRREGSLDSAIDESTLVANDFAAFLRAHPRIGAIYFNGAKAWHSYRKHVLPGLPRALAAIPTRCLPSTSPANASYSFERKLQHWLVIGDAPHPDSDTASSPRLQGERARSSLLSPRAGRGQR